MLLWTWWGLQPSPQYSSYTINKLQMIFFLTKWWVAFKTLLPPVIIKISSEVFIFIWSLIKYSRHHPTVNICCIMSWMSQCGWVVSLYVCKLTEKQHNFGSWLTLMLRNRLHPQPRYSASCFSVVFDPPVNFLSLNCVLRSKKYAFSFTASYWITFACF